GPASCRAPTSWRRATLAAWRPDEPAARRHMGQRGGLMETQIILQVLNGLVVGSSIALVASGLALLFGVLHIINFAQGDFFMLGGYAVWFALNLTGNYLLAMIVGTLVVAILGGALLSAIFSPLLQRSPR